MSDIKVNITYNTDEFRRNVDKFIDEVKNQELELLKKAATFFVTGATKFTPPDIGKNSIEKKFYTRPIQLLKEVVMSSKSSMIDQVQFKNGMKYKIVNTKGGEKRAYAYCKTLAEAKSLAKIANRGLARVMWGKDLPSIGVPVPAAVRALLRKSPNLEKLDLSHASITDDNGSRVLEIVNDSEKIERFAKFAESHGYDNAERGIKRWMTDFVKQNKEL